MKYTYFEFFPNGVDYGFIRRDENGFSNIYINIDGVEKQLTTYPGNVSNFDILPGGNRVVFSAERRGEIQSWIINI